MGYMECNFTRYFGVDILVENLIKKFTFGSLLRDN